MKICTIIARNYLPQARVLAESLKRHHPDLTLQVMVFDDGPVHQAGEPFEIVRPSDLNLSVKQFHQMATIYDVMELATAVKPWLLEYLLDSGANVAVYLDPDIEIFDRLDEIELRAAEHEIVLTPHTVNPMPRDGRYIGETDILLAGVYNLGFIAVGQRARPFLEWWQERLSRDCISAGAQGYFVDQRWVDFVPGLFPHFILRDPGYNVAYWNLGTRKVLKEDGRYTVNGAPLRFFHFSGYSPETPYLLSKHQQDKPRVLLSEHPIVAELCSYYGHKLIEAGHGQEESGHYGFSYAADGLKITPEIRRLCRNSLVGGGGEFPDPFNLAEAGAFTDWLNISAPGSPNRKISRFLQCIYDMRPDLKVAFPELYGPDADRFLQWVREDLPGQLREFPVQLWPAQKPAATATDAGQPQAELKPGINIAGYFSTESGVGEAGRSLVSVLDEGGIPHSVIPFNHTPSRQENGFDGSRIAAPRHDVNLICVNADQFPVFIGNVGRELLDGRHTIGLWAWELEQMPEQMTRRAAELVDEVWVYSKHAARAVSQVLDKPVYICPLPIMPAEAPQLSRADLGMPDGFMFLFCFDFFSIMERKNPMGLIEAFKVAFTPDEGPNLVIKCINGHQRLVQLEQLRAAAAGRPDIFIIDGYLSRDEQHALMKQCDAYVSLHRAEGYGLTMAEAMSLGKPAIATGYSGNLEFMSQDNSYLVPFTRTEIPVGCDPYPAGYLWAEPDIGAAASFMREVYRNPEKAKVKAEQARRDIIERHSPKARVAFVQERLEAIRSQKRDLAPVQAEPSTALENANGGTGKEMAAACLATDPDPGSPTRFGGAGRYIRRLIFRALRHYDVHQRQTGQALLQAIREADERREAEFARLSASAAGIDAYLQYLQTSFSAKLDAFKAMQMTFCETLNAFNSDLKALDLKSVDEQSRIEGIESVIEELNAHLMATPYMSDPAVLNITGDDGLRALGYTGRENGKKGSFYLDFENIFRGSEDFIRERQSKYLSVLSGHEPVIDAGCGRGEMMDLLARADIPATGVDLEEDMVKHCRQKGLNVEHGDIVKYLDRQKDGTVGAIFSSQVIEHLPLGDLMKFIELAYAKLKPGGVLITETVNPHSLRALKTFWVDLSHQKPIFPETAITICRHFGFEEATVMFPNGTGKFDEDLMQQGEYAVVAVKSATAANKVLSDEQSEISLSPS